MQQGGDIDSNPECSDSVSLIELELGHKRCRSMLEPSFILSGLNGVFDRHNLVFRVLDPSKRRRCWSTPLAAVLSSAFDVRLDLLPVRKVPLDASNPFNQPRDCLIGCTFVGFVDLYPRSPWPFRPGLVLKRDTTDQNGTRVFTSREGGIDSKVFRGDRKSGILLVGRLKRLPFRTGEIQRRIRQT